MHGNMFKVKPYDFIYGKNNHVIASKLTSIDQNIEIDRN